MIKAKGPMYFVGIVMVWVIVVLGVLAFTGIGLVVLVPIVVRIVMMLIPFLVLLLIGYALYLAFLRNKTVDTETQKKDNNL